jgi:hypothetical protein
MIHSSRLIVYFLCRLKINHDSHEFILEFGTVANNRAYVSETIVPLYLTLYVESIYVCT